jgi:biotin--protein ligase
MEELVEKFNSGAEGEVYALYHKYWLHTGQMVNVQTQQHTVDQATVLCIDDFGYLRLRDSTGAEFSVFDDGNSFDMMRGLIRPKV